MSLRAEELALISDSSFVFTLMLGSKVAVSVHVYIFLILTPNKLFFSCATWLLSIVFSFKLLFNIWSCSCLTLPLGILHWDSSVYVFTLILIGDWFNGLELMKIPIGSTSSQAGVVNCLVLKFFELFPSRLNRFSYFCGFISFDFFWCFKYFILGRSGWL